MLQGSCTKVLSLQFSAPADDIGRKPSISPSLGVSLWLKLFARGPAPLRGGYVEEEAGPDKIVSLHMNLVSFPSLSTASGSWASLHELCLRRRLSRSTLREFTSSNMVDSFISNSVDRQMDFCSRSPCMVHSLLIPIVQARDAVDSFAFIDGPDGFRNEYIFADVDSAPYSVTFRALTHTWKAKKVPRLFTAEGERWPWFVTGSPCFS